MTKEYYEITKKTNLGHANICTQVFEAIAYGSMTKIDGAWVNLPSGFPKTGKHPISARLVDEESISLSVEVIIKYGLNINSITHQIQEKIKDNIKQMTNIAKCKVDVVIKSIEF